MKHKFIHNGATEYFFEHIILNIDLIETAVIEVVKLVYNIQLKNLDYKQSLLIDSVQFLNMAKSNLKAMMLRVFIQRK